MLGYDRCRCHDYKPVCHDTRPNSCTKYGRHKVRTHRTQESKLKLLLRPAHKRSHKSRGSFQLAGPNRLASPRATHSHSPHTPDPIALKPNIVQGVLLLLLYACRCSEHHRQVAAAHKLRAAG